MERGTRYEDHPMRKEQRGKLKIQYIHGLGRAVRSFSTWAHEEGYLEENIMRWLKLPQLPKTLPEPLTEVEADEAAQCDRLETPLCLFTSNMVLKRRLIARVDNRRLPHSC